VKECFFQELGYKDTELLTRQNIVFITVAFDSKENRDIHLGAKKFSLNAEPLPLYDENSLELAIFEKQDKILKRTVILNNVPKYIDPDTLLDVFKQFGQLHKIVPFNLISILVIEEKIPYGMHAVNNQQHNLPQGSFIPKTFPWNKFYAIYQNSTFNNTIIAKDT